MPESTRALKNEKHWAVNHSSHLSITASLSDPRLLFTQAPWMRKSLVTVSVNRQWILKVRVWSGRIGIRAHFQDKHSDLKVRCVREALKRLAGVCAMLNTGEPANSPLTPSRFPSANTEQKQFQARFTPSRSRIWDEGLQIIRIYYSSLFYVKRARNN